MSYSSGVLDLQPYFYFPMDIKDGLVPLDVQENVTPVISGDYGYEISTRFFSGPLELPSNSFFLLPDSSDFFSAEATYSFWVSSDLVEDTLDIFSIHSGSDGVGISYFTPESELTLHFYNQSTESFALDFKEPVLFTITVASGTITFYVNNEIIFDSSNFAIPANPEIALGSLSDFAAAGAARFSDLFYSQSALNVFQINNLYSLGYNGYEELKVDSASSILINDVDNSFLQTTWQAYGEVTTKR